MMATQNLISAALADDVRMRILQKLTEIRSELDFLITLNPDQLKGLFKVSNGFAPLIDRAYAVGSSHPEILPRYFSLEEMAKDIKLIQSLRPIQDLVNELASGIRDTMVAANSDALIQSLEIYTAVKQFADRIPGLAVVQTELGAYFQRSRLKTSESGANGV